MNITIRFVAEKQAMWFLGSPRPRPKLSLTFAEPGPATLDFSSLSYEEQVHILNSVQKELISVEPTFDVLLKEHKASFIPIEEKPVEYNVVAIDPDVTSQDIAVNKAEKVLEKHRLGEEDLQRRCHLIHKKGVRAFKAALVKEKDIRVFKTLYRLETMKVNSKQRQSVLDFLLEKIRKFEGEVIKGIEQAVKAAPLIDPAGVYDKITYEIEESDQELVTFAAGQPLKSPQK